MIVDIENFTAARHNSLSVPSVRDSLVKSESIPTLTCIKFHEKFELEVNDAVVGCYSTRRFKLKNIKATSTTICTEKLSNASGITVGLGPNHSDSIEILPAQEVVCTLFWKPAASGKIRESITLIMDNKIKLQFIVYGAATADNKVGKLSNSNLNGSSIVSTNIDIKVSSKIPTLTSFVVGANSVPQQSIQQVKTVPAVSSAIEDFVVIKQSEKESTKSNIPTKAPPVLSSTNKTSTNKSLKLYGNNDSFAKQQIKTFTDWMNFTFYKSHLINEEDVDDEGSLVSTSSSSIQLMNPDEITGGADWKGIMDKQYENTIRLKAMVIYKELMKEATGLKSMQREVENGRIAVRDDRDLHLDFGLQESVLELFFCYDLQWLKLGLECIFQTVIPFQFSCSTGSTGNGVSVKRPVPINGTNGLPMDKVTKLRSTLRSFMIKHLFHYQVPNQQDIMTKHRNYEQIMKDATCKYILKRCFALIYFLDYLRNINLLSHPMLFVKKALCKSSKDILIEFCKTFLKNQGDIIRHLGTIHYYVTFEQQPIDEIDFTIKDLMQDIRDGIRLSKLFEILTETPNQLCSKLLVPADTRLRKIHNVNQVVQSIQEFQKILQQQDGGSVTSSKSLKSRNSSSSSISSSSALSNVDPKLIVDGAQNAILGLLAELMYTFELKVMIDSKNVMKEISHIHTSNGMKKYGSVKTDMIELEDIRMIEPSELDALPIQYRADKAKKFYSEEESLLAWCQCIYNELYLVGSTQSTTTRKVENLTDSLADGKVICMLIHYYHPLLIPDHIIQSILTTAHNASTSAKLEQVYHYHINMAIKLLGGIPSLLRNVGSHNIPPESTTVVFLGYLFNRLTETSKQVHSARLLQRTFRKYIIVKKAKKQLQQLQTISRNKKNVEYQLLMRDRLISFFRICKAKSELWCRKAAVQSIHRAWKKHIDRTHLLAALQAIHVQMKAIVSCQSVVRRYFACKRLQELKKKCACAVKIQSLFRMHIQRTIFLIQRASTSLLQAVWRKYQLNQILHQQYLIEVKEKQHFSMLMKMASKLQKWYHWRMFCRKLHSTIKSLHSFVAHYRGCKVRQSMQAQKFSAWLIQFHWRQYQLRKEAKVEFSRLQKFANDVKLHILCNCKASIIQQQWKQYCLRKNAKEQLSLLRLQAMELKYFTLCNGKAIIIQARSRSFLHRQVFLQKLSAIYMIQRCYRFVQCKRRIAKGLQTIHFALHQFRKLTCVIQIHLPKKKLNHLKKIYYVACKIQSCYRMQKCRRQFTLQMSCIRLIQALWKKQQLKKLLNQMKEEERGQYLMTIRQRQAVHTITKWYSNKRFFARLHKVIDSFHRLQAIYRAYRIRKALTPKVKQLLFAIRSATQRAMLNPSTRIQQRAEHALDILHNGSMISQYIKACQSLLACTKYSRGICELFVFRGSSVILFRLLQSCNRSTPHQELLRVILEVLLNVCQHDHLANAVASVPHATEIIVDLMQTFRDKSTIFHLATEIMIYFAQSNEKAKKLCKEPLYFKRLDGIYHIIERKTRVETRVRDVTEHHPLPAASSKTSKMTRPVSSTSSRMSTVKTFHHNTATTTTGNTEHEDHQKSLHTIHRLLKVLE